MNKICLIGRLVRDTELRVNDKNISQTTFTLAVPRNYKNQDGEYETDFINCVSWQKLAETINKYCHKGDQLGVEGKLQINMYQDKEGNNRYATNVVVENITFVQAKKETEEQPKEKDPFEGFESEPQFTEDDLPF